MRIWTSHADAQRAAGTIKKFVEETGTIPAELIKAYRASMKNARPGIVARFYEALAEQCPEAMKYFVTETEN